MRSGLSLSPVPLAKVQVIFAWYSSGPVDHLHRPPFISFGTVSTSEPPINILHKDSLRAVTTSSLRTGPTVFRTLRVQP